VNPRTDSWLRTFLIIFTGQSFSLLGSAAVNFALVWWITAETGSATVLAYA
jgi:DHA3 family macrolide efflux protein-like MFS transporter